MNDEALDDATFRGRARDLVDVGGGHVSICDVIRLDDE